MWALVGETSPKTGVAALWMRKAALKVHHVETAGRRGRPTQTLGCQRVTRLRASAELRVRSFASPPSRERTELKTSRRFHAQTGLVIAALCFAAGCAAPQAAEGDVAFDDGNRPPPNAITNAAPLERAPSENVGTTGSETETTETTDPAAPIPTSKPIPIWQPAELHDAEVQASVIAVSRKYNLPRWFYYAVIHREST